METANTEPRVETDSLGEMSVPGDALYGASTARALENFPISGMTMPLPLIHALAMIKKACAFANLERGELDSQRAQLITQAAEEIREGRHDHQFQVDIFQTGSGTSTNMNVNEVIANRCSQLADEPIGSKKPVHPNDHVNKSQSSNDTIPTALHLSVALEIRDTLQPAIKLLARELEEKAALWNETIKLGRTHLMDATPITLGQEFSGYARQLRKAEQRCQRAIDALSELALGGTAVGTGLNAPSGFAQSAINFLRKDTMLDLSEAQNHFEAQAARDDLVEVAGHLCALCSSLTKIANDIRLLGSGPRSGLGELTLPATQPGSSIMPGKVNPVMPEMLVQVSHYAIGQCQTVTRCGQDGHFELNATMPLIAHCIHSSIHCLANGITTFAKRCIADLKANESTCSHHAHNAIGLATALNPHVGYDTASSLAQKAHETGESVKATALAQNILSEEKLDEILDPKRLAFPNAHENA
ncbi:class II fumarate hydratase [Pelagicoccus sp. SDUM812003]|uniref:class II fumarate hydratase n=1 Tax=Pelagicoccus sp. SDUM812003 TaxID=3041267 RepID=UPI00280C51E2|nr:class II fumarate hydratase [Pelagicoccus sp. SDUM812003]MDQ8205529.1 class II fumarate hydratase [Pelagicoccus sp. SDUM812003]